MFMTYQNYLRFACYVYYNLIVIHISKQTIKFELGKNCCLSHAGFKKQLIQLHNILFTSILRILLFQCAASPLEVIMDDRPPQLRHVSNEDPARNRLYYKISTNVNLTHQNYNKRLLLGPNAEIVLGLDPQSEVTYETITQYPDKGK